DGQAGYACDGTLPPGAGVARNGPPVPRLPRLYRRTARHRPDGYGTADRGRQPDDAREPANRRQPPGVRDEYGSNAVRCRAAAAPRWLRVRPTWRNPRHHLAPPPHARRTIPPVAETRPQIGRESSRLLRIHQAGTAGP